MYLALYRKYRPRTFDDVISQEHITTTLKNQVISGSVGHAYLFIGSRGTGKTTCAKILAMAVNCLDPKDGNPCLECERCREILDGTTTDIVEMDAASNNGVDDVRQLRDEVAYTPVSCKYRVYIIDEVHMLSTAAFNALLKTLEEPPPHVKFILATTELHKVPATISSRCQRFEFRRVDIADSAKRLLEVAEKEGVSLERDAAEFISRLSDGGMRDALSILDRCISADKHITSESVRACAGVVDRKHLFLFAEMIARRDTAGCFRLLGELYQASKDVSLIMSEISGIFRDIMIYKTAPDDKDLLTALPDEYEELARITEMYSVNDILRCLTLLQQCADNIGKAKQRKTLAEMCLVKMCMGGQTAAKSDIPVQPVYEIKQAPVERPTLRPVEEMSLTERKTRALLEETAKFIETPAPVPQSAPVPTVPQNAPVPTVPQSAPVPTVPQSAPVPTVPQSAPVPTVPQSAPVPTAKVSPAASSPAPPMEDLFEPPPYTDDDVPPISDDDAPPLDDEYPSPKSAFGSMKNAKSAAVRSFPNETVKSVPKEPIKAVPNKNAKKKQSEDAPAQIREVASEEWMAALAKLADIDLSVWTMLQGSSVRTEGGCLAISSGNRMLIENVKGDELTRVEGLISEVLGFPVRIVIKTEISEDPEGELSEIDKFLNKAREIGIDVAVKKQ